jgi:short-subunit dehydrogenase
VTEIDAATIQAVMTTNVIGVTNLFATVIPGMVQRKTGNLGAIASIAGILGLPGAAAYSGSKAAVMRFCDSLRVDLYQHQVRVTTICPGFIDTSMITEIERATLKNIVSAPVAARRIMWAIERGKVEDSFPWHTWLEAKVASFLPFGIFRRAMVWFGEMEESSDHGA